MTIDIPTGIPVDYDFDEEEIGFGAPQPAAEAPTLAPAHKGALGLVGLGLLSLVVQIFGGPLAGTWPGLLSSFGLITVGAALSFWVEHKDTTPGIKHDGIWFKSVLARGGAGWIAGILMTGLYVLIYWYPRALGERPAPEPNVGLVRVVDPLKQALIGTQADRWFLYGVLYTLAILVFGVRMWMKYRHNRYHRIRTLSVSFFQLGFAFFLPNLLVRFQQPYMEFNGVWPLKQDYLWPSKVGEFWNSGGLGVFLMFWALVAALVATPVLTYFYGKRWYCSWVCGCGGLAETLGDPWRQLSDKSSRAWTIERWVIHTVLALVLIVTLALWINHLTGFLGDAHRLKQWYGLYIGAIFSGVVGVGFYPLLGNRVWCRFGCPQAAILGLWQRLFSRFRITTNGGQCMSCGNCSTYCEMGIDVRAYAQRQENIIRASCVGCGVCATVCPRGVLKLENGKTHGDRYGGSDQPLRAFLEGLDRDKQVP
ncbi:MAG: 4Fe-4S binding protein [bacterium]|nr:4Fe-4S binding protein [bacterium]